MTFGTMTSHTFPTNASIIDFFLTEHTTILRRSNVLSLSLLLVFLGIRYQLGPLYCDQTKLRLICSKLLRVCRRVDKHSSLFFIVFSATSKLKKPWKCLFPRVLFAPAGFEPWPSRWWGDWSTTVLPQTTNTLAYSNTMAITRKASIIIGQGPILWNYLCL